MSEVQTSRENHPFKRFFIVGIAAVCGYVMLHDSQHIKPSDSRRNHTGANAELSCQDVTIPGLSGVLDIEFTPHVVSTPQAINSTRVSPLPNFDGFGSNLNMPFCQTAHQRSQRIMSE